MNTIHRILINSQYRFYNSIAQTIENINAEFEKTSSLIIKPVFIDETGLEIHLELAVNDPLFYDIGFIPSDQVRLYINSFLINLSNDYNTDLSFMWTNNKHLHIKYNIVKKAPDAFRKLDTMCEKELKAYSADLNKYTS